MRAGRTDTLSTPARTASLLFLFCSVLLAWRRSASTGTSPLGRCLAVTAVLAVAWQGGCCRDSAGHLGGIGPDLGQANGDPCMPWLWGWRDWRRVPFPAGGSSAPRWLYVLV